jgi:carbamoylphosphate synthase large subunit
MAKKNILITSAGTGNAFALATAINTNFKDSVNLMLADINPPELVSSSIYCSDFIRTPALRENNYKDFIVAYINQMNVDICFPFIDLDVLYMSIWFNEGIFSKELKLAVNNPETSQICSDKLLAYRWMKAALIPTPSTFPFSVSEVKNKFIVKPRNGFGSKIRKLEDIGSLSVEEQSELIMQEVCEGPEITIDVFRSFNNSLFYYLCRERIETKSGVCTKARIFLDEDLESLARVISLNLNLNYFCFQVMRLNNEWVVTDINPRYGAGTSMCSAVNVDFYSAMISDMLGLNPLVYLKNFYNEAFVTRQYVNIRTK